MVMRQDIDLYFEQLLNSYSTFINLYLSFCSSTFAAIFSQYSHSLIHFISHMFAIHLVFPQLAQEFLCAFFASPHRGGGYN